MGLGFICSECAVKAYFYWRGALSALFFFTEPILTHYVAFCNINSLEIFSQIKYTFIEILKEVRSGWQSMRMRAH